MKLGTYAIEQDYSQYVARSSEIVLAVIGTAKKGPVDLPTVCTSTLDFVNKFGNLDPDFLGLYAGQYFLSQANKLYFIRAASDSAAFASVTVPCSPVEDGNVVFIAKTEGSYYNGYKMTVSAGTVSGTYTFVIKNTRGTTVETLSDISLSSLCKQVDGTFVEAPENFVSNYFDLYSVPATGLSTSLALAEYTAANGNDGAEDIADADYITAGQTLLNDNYDFNLLSVPGVSSPAVVSSLLTVAETRGDCLYLVDSPNHLDAESVADWHNGTGDYEHTKFNSSYGALYWAWQKAYDSVNKIKVELPPSVFVAPAIANSTRMTEIWYAPAGLQRGVISGALEPVVAPTNGDRDMLYTGENSVNCIINDPQIGLCIFGQKTLSRLDSALNRVNVRMLLNYLKRIITAACRTLTFEPNDRVTWNYFEDKIEPTLRGIRDHRGIYEYRIVKGSNIVTDDDIDNYRMPCMVLIRPTKAAEEIPIYFTITSTGADFNDVLQSNGVIVEEY